MNSVKRAISGLRNDGFARDSSVGRRAASKRGSLDAVLSAIERASTTGWRNRCMYLLKDVMRYEDISHLRLLHVLNERGEVVVWLRTGRGAFVELGERTRREIALYLCKKYRVGPSSFANLLECSAYDSVFASSRRSYLTPCVVAQVLSDVERALIS